MPKWIYTLAACLAVGILLCGCGKDAQDTAETENEQEDGIQIGMSFDSFVIERWQKDRDVFVSTAKEYGAQVNVQNANGEIEEQIQQIRYLIKKKVDVLVVICIDSDKLSDVITEAKDAGIKVIAYDRLIKNAGVDLYISFDNEQVGRLMGEALAQSALPHKKVLMLNGPTTDNNVSMVESGFREVMQQSGIEIVDTTYVDGWKAELAADYLNEHTQLLEEVDAIMCGNDSIATTTIRTLAEKRLAGKIKIVGQDADLEACQRIVEGTQVMTVYKPVEKLAQAAAVYACGLAQGKSVSEIAEETGTVYHTMSDGSYYVPFIVLEPIAVNAANMEEKIIDSGFHLREDVYLNVRK